MTLVTIFLLLSIVNLVLVVVVDARSPTNVAWRAEQREREREHERMLEREAREAQKIAERQARLGADAPRREAEIIAMAERHNKWYRSLKNGIKLA